MRRWTFPASDTAQRIGNRAVELLIDHDGGHAFSERDRHLIARACALAADEVIRSKNCSEEARS